MTVFNSGPGNMRNNNKGISQTFFNTCTSNRRLLPPTPHHSAIADMTLVELCAPVHHSFLLSQSCSVPVAPLLL